MDTGHIADDLLTQMYHNSKKAGAAPAARPRAGPTAAGPAARPRDRDQPAAGVVPWCEFEFSSIGLIGERHAG